MKVVFVVALLLHVFLRNDGARPPHLATTSHLIVNGIDARDGEFPWQVSLASDGLYHFCGGSLIDKLWVVTARHCIVDKQGNVVKNVDTWLFVVAGVNDVRRRSWSLDADKILVKKVYTRKYKSEDIALLELSRPANVSRPDISPIKIAANNERFLGHICVTSGWGQYLENVQFTNIPRVLQKTYLTVYPNFVCDYFWGRDQVYNYDMCVASANSAPCMGDSGGPLVCKRFDGTELLAGVTSWGSEECIKNHPALYKRLSYWRPWIRHVTKLDL